MPLMMFPNPQPQPTGDGANANWDPEVLVYRPWQPDELKEVAETLPDPQKTGGEKWITAMHKLLSLYEPTLKEVEAVCRRAFKLRWTNIRPTSWSTNHQVRTREYENMMDTLYEAVRTIFPLRLCWPEIHNTKYKEGESAVDCRTRMEIVFAAHSGIDTDNVAHSDLLKAALINGLHPGLKNHVMTTCVGWETEPITTVWTHVLHAERNQTDLDIKQTKKLQSAQMMYYQRNNLQESGQKRLSHQNNSGMRSRGWRRAGPHKSSQRRYDDTDRRMLKCYKCEGFGHLSHDCATPDSYRGERRESRRSWPHADPHRGEGEESKESWPHASPQELSVQAPGFPLMQP